MLTSDEIQALQLKASRITDPVISYIIEDVCQRIAQAGELAGQKGMMTATAEYRLFLAQTIGTDWTDLAKEIRRRLNLSQAEMDTLFVDAARQTYDNQIKLFGGAHTAFENNATLQQIVKSSVSLADQDFQNITQTLGMTNKDGTDMPLKDFYQHTMDGVFNRVSTGAVDYNTAMREATAMLAEKGITSIGYEKGKTTSLEAAVRRNIMGGLGLMVEQVQYHTHQQLGADGWEMSAHSNSAKDHESYQGRQYTDAEWLELNGGPQVMDVDGTILQAEVTGKLKRRIGTLNCGYNAFSIIIGVNLPLHTEEQILIMRDTNAEPREYSGKEYTGYEATQRMREIERNIRYWQKKYGIAVNTFSSAETAIASSHIVNWRRAYTNFSKAVGLRKQPDRLFVYRFSDATKKAADLGYVVPQVR